MHIHLDPLGGVAGDMFVAALLDLRPELAPAAIAAVRAAGLGDDIRLTFVPFSDGILAGSRFDVAESPKRGLLKHGGRQAQAVGHTHEHRHTHEHQHTHHEHEDDAAGLGGAYVYQRAKQHSHTRWFDIRARLEASALEPAVCRRAIEIFTLLAEAEARVHDKPVADVSFHEVGAWDSIADIVAAAFLIESLMPCEWSIGPIPIGSGLVSTAHGMLPVPAPATALLLDGFLCFDDGLQGERVTPTGAAIIRHLRPAGGIGQVPRRLKKSAHGFGTRRLPGRSNVLRALEFETAVSSVGADRVAVINFEIDDQTPEDLAEGLDRLRAVEGVIDVTQHPATGKRGRTMAAIQLLAKPESTATVSAACFAETTTLGLRVQVTDRLILSRHEALASDGVRVKFAQRPAGLTAKADIKDVADADGHSGRQRLRERAVSEVESK
jgi:uncharacterized protein (TIGR00299 family) protein